MTPDPVIDAANLNAPESGDVVRDHQTSLLRYLRVLGASPEEAKDLLQETFVVYLRAEVQDRGAAALRVWLRSTARNVFLADCRARRRTPVALDEAAVERAFAAYERDDDGAAYRDALRVCLSTLPARQHELLLMQVNERADAAHLARAAGLSLEAVRSLLRRIKVALRDCVHRRLRHDA